MCQPFLLAHQRLHRAPRAGKTSDAQSLAMIRRALALLEAEPAPGPAEASGLWCMMWMGVQNRAAIAQAVFEESLPVAMATASSEDNDGVTRAVPRNLASSLR